MSDNFLELVITADGSASIYNAAVGENYHSKHGALQESQHVFVNSGLLHYFQLHKKNEISILEIGFGTGLNFLLSADLAMKNSIHLHYRGIEKYPLSIELFKQTNYINHLQNKEIWEQLNVQYQTSYQEKIRFEQYIDLQNYACDLLEFRSDEKFDVVYFDAFAAVHQPEMWERERIAHACSFLKDKGIFVTYSVTGELKRILKSLNFNIERPQGAAGKREMMRATKL